MIDYEGSQPPTLQEALADFQLRQDKLAEVQQLKALDAMLDSSSSAENWDDVLQEVEGAIALIEAAIQRLSS